MTKPIPYRRRQALQHLVLLVWVGELCAAARTTVGQVDDVPGDLRDRVPIIDGNGRIAPGTLPPSMVDEEGRPVAHLHNSDMSCCAPCASETNIDPDVCQRPCFTRALRKARKYRGECDGLTAAAEVRLTQEHVPARDIEHFRGLLNTVIQSASLPRAWNEVRFEVPARLKAVVDVRGSVPTYVGVEVDRTPGGTDLNERDPIVTRWPLGEIEVLPVTWHYPENSREDAVIRLRLRGDERLELRQRPEEFGTREARQGFFDKEGFHGLLTTVFRVPFHSPDDWFTDGYDATYEGVRVFHGYIVARERRRVWVGGDDPPQHWWEQMRLLVTDSDPQYFCVEVSLGPADEVPGGP